MTIRGTHTKSIRIDVEPYELWKAVFELFGFLQTDFVYLNESPSDGFIANGFKERGYYDYYDSSYHGSSYYKYNLVIPESDKERFETYEMLLNLMERYKGQKEKADKE